MLDLCDVLNGTKAGGVHVVDLVRQPRRHAVNAGHRGLRR